jgi:NAD(P) transhydrogenase subunit alpha
MVVGVLKEVSPETRVSLIAEGVAQLTKKQIKVWVESGAGMNAFCSDEDYLAAGAEIKSSQEIADHADVVLSIHAFSAWNCCPGRQEHKAWTFCQVRQTLLVTRRY